MNDYKERIDRMRQELESEIDFEGVWRQGYKEVLAQEIDEEKRQEGREQAEADIRKQRTSKRGLKSGSGE